MTRSLSMLAVLGVIAVAVAGCGGSSNSSSSSKYSAELIGIVTPKGATTLKDQSGKLVKEIKAGPYTLILEDQSKSRGFMIQGSAIGVLSTSVSGTPRLTYHVDFTKGTYRYWSAPGSTKKLTLRVT